jgi:hypothetical protein
MKLERLILISTLVLVLFCLKLIFFDFESIQKLTNCNVKECNCDSTVKKILLDVSIPQEVTNPLEDYSEHYYDQFAEIKSENSINKNLQMCFLNYTSLSKFYLS